MADYTGLLQDLFKGGEKPRALLGGLLGSGTSELSSAWDQIKQLGDPNYMKQVKPMSMDEAKNIALMGLTAGGNVGTALLRSSKAQNIADGLYHSVGLGKKMNMSVENMTADHVPLNNLQESRIVSPESMFGGKLIPASGDRTATGTALHSVNGNRLATPVNMEGGAKFMLAHPNDNSVWASDSKVINTLANKTRQLSADGSDVYMPFVAMGHGASNFNTMMTDSLLEQMKGGNIPQGLLHDFNGEVQALRPEFLGVNHPDVRSQLDATGALRHVFNDRMQLDKYKEYFPDITATRAAITDPNLMNVPIHSSGYTIAKLDPAGKVISNPVNPHSTYNTQLGGEYFGGLEHQVPRDVMFSDFYKARRGQGADPSGDMRSFQLSNPTQVAHQEWLDGMMKYLESVKQ